MWKEVISIMLFAVYTISADDLTEEDRPTILSAEGESFSEDAEESHSASAGELGKRFLRIGYALRRVTGALTGAVTAHMSARRPPANAHDDDFD